MSLAEIPVVSVQRRGEIEVFRPTTVDRHSGIDKSLVTRGVVTLSAGNHRCLSLDPVYAHHPTASHTIHWIDRDGPIGMVHPWEDRVSWGRVAEDAIFLHALQALISKKQHSNPKLRFYFFNGWVPADDEVRQLPDAYSETMQTQGRMHVHETDGLESETPYKRLLSVHEEADRKMLMLFANIAGERSIQAHNDLLHEFGHRFIYRQRVGVTAATTRERTFFGFDDLSKALLAALGLQDAARVDWPRHVREVAREPYGEDGVWFEVKQSCVPNMVISFPSPNDRQAANAGAEYPVWVAPFSVAPTQSLFDYGAVVKKEE